MRHLAPALLLVPIALLLPACGGGGGDGGTDLGGWWVLALETGPTSYEPFSVLHLEDEGTTVWIEGLAYSEDGDVLRGGDPDRVSPDRTDYDLAILSDDLLEGPATEYHAGVPTGSHAWRLTRTAVPDGTLTIDGLIDGVAVSRGSVTAHAEERGGTDWYSIRLVDSRRDGVSYVQFHFAVPGPLVPGSWPVGNSPLGNVMGVQTDGTGGSSHSGTVTFTSFADHRIVGTYSVALEGGGSVTGSFDVPSLLPTGP